MLTNKRDLKKYINRMSEEVAQSILPAAVVAKVIDNEKAENILTDISMLSTKALSKINISFDKSPEAFASVKAYAAAKKAYYREAYAKLLTEFEDGIQKLIEPINKALTQK